MVPKKAQFVFTFSYWIFAWFLLYRYEFTKYNPKIWIIIALFINIFEIINLIYYKNYIRTLFFIFFVIIIKIIPLYLLINTKYKFVDFIAGFCLLIIYFLFMYFFLGSVKNICKYFKNLNDAVKQNKASTPLISYLESRINVK